MTKKMKKTVTRKMLIGCLLIALVASMFAMVGCSSSNNGIYYYTLAEMQYSDYYIEIDGDEATMNTYGVELEYDIEIDGKYIYFYYYGVETLSGTISDGTIKLLINGLGYEFTKSSGSSSSNDDCTCGSDCCEFNNSNGSSTSVLSGTYVNEDCSLTISGNTADMYYDNILMYTLDVTNSSGIYYFKYLGVEIFTGVLSGNNLLVTSGGETKTFIKQ